MQTPNNNARTHAPAAIQATGFPLPALYLKIMELSWSRMDPWTFVGGEEFLALHQELNGSFAQRGETPARMVVPFATCLETKAVACIQVVPESQEILLVHRGEAFEVLAILPTFEAWLRLALEDVIRNAAGGAPGNRRPSKGNDLSATTNRLAFECEPESESESRATTRRHLMRVLRESEIDLDFVSAEAGDQEISSPSVRRHHERVVSERGEQLYVDMLFLLTQHRYPDRVAKWLWSKILQHKLTLGRRLGRDVEVTVASLDYLNQHEHLVEGSLVLCSEDELTQVADVALRDGLTGLFDQSTFRARLTRELERVRRYDGPLSLLMLDLDHFKDLNDEHGHLVGDRVLTIVGGLLRDSLRSVDLAARYGGEEFAVILPQTELAEAERLAERLRKAIEDSFAGDLNVTVSVGVAACREDGDQPDRLIEAADTALYRSKELGRNRTTRASSPGPGASA